MKRLPFLTGVIGLTLLCALTAQARQHATVTAALNLSALPQGTKGVVAIVTDINPGLHAESANPKNEVPFVLKANPNPAVDFQPPVYPPGLVKTFLGIPVDVYVGKTVAYLPFVVKSTAPPGPIHLSGIVHFQACSDLTSTCYLPESVPFSVDSQIVAAGTPTPPANASLFAAFSTSQNQQPAPPPAMPPSAGGTSVSLFGHQLNLQDQPVAIVAMIAFLAGIIFNVVPCVLPVLPLKAIGFYEVAQHNRARTILLGFVFSCGLVCVFLALAILILASKSLFGHQITWGQWFGYPWFVWAVAAVLAILGIGMLGAFSVRLPTSIYGLDFRHDTLGGNFMWGILTAILSTPCTAPLFPAVLAVALVLPKWEGTFLVTMVGVGMASPYFLLSAFPEVARKFPRTGAAAELVKQMMGFLLLGSAAFFAGLELVGQPNQWWIVFAVVVWACLYMVIRTAQISKASGPLCAVTGLAVTLTAAALVLTLDLTDTLAALSGAAPAGVDWQPYSAAGFSQARASGHIVLVDFTADWCLNCKYVESSVYHDKRTLDALKRDNVVTIKADLTNHDEPGYQLYDRLGITGIPYTAIYFPGEDKPVGLASIYTTDTLLNVLSQGQPQAVAQTDGDR